MMCDAGGVLAPVTEAVREMVKKLIKQEPTADVEPVRHGRWYENNIGDAVCSNCKGIQDKYEVVFMPYCPNCGCKLDLEKEEEKK
jgi:hypothetical protein